MTIVTDFLKKVVEYNTPSEWRESTKLITATFLAISSWSLLGWLAYSQFKASESFALQLAATTSTDKDRIALIKDANETVNKTASSLYALLIPIASAITGYFFVSSATASPPKERDRLSGSLPSNTTSSSLAPDPKL
ncbi:hypothetical protein [Chamaesiphon minutus]|uniref:Uncharacterized protein n=1 Tax=Chamaesiphon minutus (strain ATCC 27169 / PCC 6605) TaxID=1173020 RepID=K9UFI5_CHAP6|nr:hypothetical protein [Chamaesiphon minutus]AFY93408.1 hypothetical protein Cha6605_2333 [Chamaesiphon minutus PCC 6605]